MMTADLEPILNEGETVLARLLADNVWLMLRQRRNKVHARIQKTEGEALRVLLVKFQRLTNEMNHRAEKITVQEGIT